MRKLVESIGTRVIPGILIALGVTMMTAGLFTYSSPVEAGPLIDRPPVVVSLATPTPAPRATFDLLAGASFVPSTPLPDPLPAGWPTDPSDRVATRVVVRDLRVDLAIIRPQDETYPLCDVAMYFINLYQPGSGQAIYLYAHARSGMFLPILDASKVANGERMLGMIVDVYTSDDLVFHYQVMEVRRHQLSLGDAFSATSEQLWLQTSEGPKGTPGKTQVIARPASMSKAGAGDAHPAAHPRVCE